MDDRARAAELVRGTVDIHVHPGPDVFPRLMSDIEIAGAAKAAGMGAVLLKSHVECTASRAKIAGEVTGMTVFGGLALNFPAGGLNVEAVKTAIGLGAREIWMPTIHAKHYLGDVDQVPMFAKLLKKGTVGIELFCGGNTLKDEVKEILDVIAEADIIAATGHISKPEGFAFVEEAVRRGVKKVLVTHPTSPMEAYTNEEMAQLAGMGAVLEHVVNDITHQMKNPIQPSVIADAIRATGAEHNIMSTDSGQVINPPPVKSMENFIFEMLQLGISEAEIRVMTVENPGKILHLQ